MHLPLCSACDKPFISAIAHDLNRKDCISNEEHMAELDKKRNTYDTIAKEN
jgi:hypothetical protein